VLVKLEHLLDERHHAVVAGNVEQEQVDAGTDSF